MNVATNMTNVSMKMDELSFFLKFCQESKFIMHCIFSLICYAQPNTVCIRANGIAIKQRFCHNTKQTEQHLGTRFQRFISICLHECLLVVIGEIDTKADASEHCLLRRSKNVVVQTLPLPLSLRHECGASYRERKDNRTYHYCCIGLFLFHWFHNLIQSKRKKNKKF